MATDGSEGDTQDPQITARLAETLARAPVLFDRLAATARAGITPGSPAAQDATSELGHHTRIMAIDHLATGLEHLVIWHRLLTGGSQPFATHMTLIRGAMEGAVTSRWLTDPRQDAAERVRRGVALLLDDYGNRRDFERDFGLDPAAIKPPAKSGADRYKELQAERDAAKIGPIKVPSMTYRFGGYGGLQPGPGRAIYRLLSAYAHGKQWKGLTTKIQAVEEATEVRGGKVVKVTANDDMSVMLTALAMKVAMAAVDEVDGYCGAQ
jgi:hypothetical protein